MPNTDTAGHSHLGKLPLAGLQGVNIPRTFRKGYNHSGFLLREGSSHSDTHVPTLTGAHTL